MITTGMGDNIAHAGHVGGFLAGVFFTVAFKKLFQEKHQAAKINIRPAGLKPSLRRKVSTPSKSEPKTENN